ncbi:TraR/DksA family transcriptional regulator [Pseudodesulfovibrio sp.]|uniref:TraR/DksA family transcriptional regulator n=1 Tax=unclassified Pseudodesulfovibrio TaxID=2661612 RepID=UPI003B0088FC
MTETNRKAIRNHLMHTLSVLTGQETNEPFVLENCPDETDFASQLTLQGVNMAVRNRRSARITELEAALKRVTEKHFGICDECGDSIGIARLKANPSARLCVRCQSELEDGLNRCA